MANYDLCSARHCNVCLLLQLNSKENPPTAAAKSDRSGKSNKNGLHTCNGCKLVVYCGAEHQRLDWQLHRSFCRAAQNIMRQYELKHPFLVSGPLKKPADLERATLQVKFLLRRHLRRPLTLYEEELTSFPAHCAVCFSLRFLQHCQHCGGVSYCSEAHRQQHELEHHQHCGLLQLYYCPHKVLPLPSDVIADLYHPVPVLAHTDLIEAFQLASECRLQDNPTISLAAYQLFATAADFSCMATICYALEQLNHPVKASCTVFVVGASFEADLWFQPLHTRLYFLQQPQVSSLTLHFIGPEVQKQGERQETYVFRGTLRTVTYIAYRGLVEDYLSECRAQPSLIVAFNCGFSEYAQHSPLRDTKHSKGETIEQVLKSDKTAKAGRPTQSIKDTWAAGLAKLLSLDRVPFVFTSFTLLEAEFDFAAIQQMANAKVCLQRLFDVRQNPFRDMRPLRNWHMNDREEPIFYRNGYVQAVSAHKR